MNYEDWGNDWELDFPEAEANDVANRLVSHGFKLASGGAVTGKDANLENVTRLLKNSGEPLAVFHFTGHGFPGGLVLADGKRVTSWHLARCFNSSHGSPFLTFLNACSTNQFDRTGLVRSIASSGGDQIIASFWSIFDIASTKFADTFYDKTEEGFSMPDAMFEARRQLMSNPRFALLWPAFAAYGGEFPLRSKLA